MTNTVFRYTVHYCICTELCLTVNLMWRHYSSKGIIRWIMGNIFIFMLIWWYIYNTETHRWTVANIVTQKQIFCRRTIFTHIQFSVYPAPILIYITRGGKSMRNWVLKISCCIFHIKPSRPLALFLFMLHYVTSDPLLWQMRLYSLHLQTSQIESS